VGRLAHVAASAQDSRALFYNPVMISARDETTIPRVFHRVWLGDAELPPEQETFGRSWLEIHRGWEMVTWTEANVPSLRNGAQYAGAQHLAQRSALVRLEVLYEYGGVYIDTDYECLRPIEPLLAGASLVAGWADARVVNNGFIAASPRHPVLDEVIGVIPYRVATRPGASSTIQSGNVLFHEVMTAHAQSDSSIRLYEPHILAPYHWTEANPTSGPFTDAYAIHHYRKSWWSKGWSPDSAPS
jgi:mannosyltransferase OCH1-like enzyme